jgi:hypothetical protein
MWATLDRQTDRQRFIDLLRSEKTDLLATIPHGVGQTILREAMLIADTLLTSIAPAAEELGIRTCIKRKEPGIRRAGLFYVYSPSSA